MWQATAKYRLRLRFEMSSGQQQTPAEPLAVHEIARILNLSETDWEIRGKYAAKLRLELLQRCAARPQGKLILVTAITPTSHGEGKTVVSIGLAQALHRLGRRAMVTLRQPSLGPIFGLKGGATGGGMSQVIPPELKIGRAHV